MERFDKAAPLFEKAVAIQPRNANFLSNFGYCRYMQGQLETAAKLLKRSVKANPEFALARQHLATVRKAIASHGGRT